MLKIYGPGLTVIFKPDSSESSKYFLFLSELYANCSLRGCHVYINILGYLPAVLHFLTMASVTSLPLRAIDEAVVSKTRSNINSTLYSIFQFGSFFFITRRGGKKAKLFSFSTDKQAVCLSERHRVHLLLHRWCLSIYTIRTVRDLPRNHIINIYKECEVSTAKHQHIFQMLTA